MRRCFPEAASVQMAPHVGHQLSLPAHPAELSRARGFADAAAAAFGLSEEQRYAFTFAANEAVSNAIEHGRPSREGTIRLSAGAEDGALVLYVEDHGSFAPGTPRVDALADRGRGLAFMAALVDEVDIRQAPTGTVVRLCKALPSAPVALSSNTGSERGTAACVLDSQ